ncbi:MAG: hypothetical protein R2806_10740 [Saprospiraceae bacterium]
MRFSPMSGVYLANRGVHRHWGYRLHELNQASAIFADSFLGRDPPPCGIFGRRYCNTKGNVHGSERHATVKDRGLQPNQTRYVAAD